MTVRLTKKSRQRRSREGQARYEERVRRELLTDKEEYYAQLEAAYEATTVEELREIVIWLLEDRES